MRRTGKTTLIRSIYEEIPSKNKLFLDLENPLNQKYFEKQDFEQIRFDLEVLGLNFKEKSYLFLDEIQNVKNLPQVIKYLYDHHKIKCVLTGSSSFYLKNLFSESLSGRKYIFELFPLNFKEFLRFKNSQIKIPDIGKPISENVWNSLSTYYEEYLMFGGFPGVVLKDNIQEKRMALEDIFSSYFQLEVVQLSDFRKTHVVRDLILLLIQRVGSKIDIQKLALELKVSRPTIYEYLAFLEGTYFIHTIKQYSKNNDVTIRGSEKVYLCDSGLLKNISEVNEGALFENNVFQLLKHHGFLNYYQKKGGREIDFIVNKKTAYEVKLTGSKKDLDKLKHLNSKLKLPELYLISKKYCPVKECVYPFQL